MGGSKGRADSQLCRSESVALLNTRLARSVRLWHQATCQSDTVIQRAQRSESWGQGGLLAQERIWEQIDIVTGACLQRQNSLREGANKKGRTGKKTRRLRLTSIGNAAGNHSLAGHWRYVHRHRRSLEAREAERECMLMVAEDEQILAVCGVDLVAPIPAP